jgi:hypothetical protein
VADYIAQSVIGLRDGATFTPLPASFSTPS